MLSIALCDDDTFTLDLLADMLYDYGKQAHCPLQISKFTTGIKLLSGTDEKPDYDIYILDYYMPFMNGIEVARKLREKDDKCIIIFSTVSMDAAIDAFEVNAFRYLLKPVSMDTITRVMNQACEQLNKTFGAFYDIRTPDGVKKVRQDDIVFIEKADRALDYHMSNGEIIHSTTIQGSVKNAVAPLLEDGGFIMAGSSFAINLYKIKAVYHGDILFCNGEEITAPRREYAAIKAAWNEHGALK